MTKEAKAQANATRIRKNAEKAKKAKESGLAVNNAKDPTKQPMDPQDIRQAEARLAAKKALMQKTTNALTPTRDDSSVTVAAVSSSVIQAPATKVTEFLTHIIRGEKSKAELLLQDNPALLEAAGKVTTRRGELLEGITGFQLAVHQLDWPMWEMIRGYMSSEVAKVQAQGFTTGAWVKEHGEHTTWQELLDQIEFFCEMPCDAEKNRRQMMVIGELQSQLPLWVLREYFHPTRSFIPPPDFTNIEFPPVDVINDFTALMDLPHWSGLLLSDLGTKFGLMRGNCERCLPHMGGLPEPDSRKGSWLYKGPKADRIALEKLLKTRIAQRDKLIADLSPSSSMTPPKMKM